MVQLTHQELLCGLELPERCVNSSQGNLSSGEMSINLAKIIKYSIQRLWRLTKWLTKLQKLLFNKINGKKNKTVALELVTASIPVHKIAIFPGSLAWS